MLEKTYTGGCDAVAGGVLDEIHGLVGEVEEFGFGARIGGVGGDADAGGDLDVEARVLQPDGFTNQSVETAGYTESVFFGGLRKQDYELVAAVAEGEIDHAALLFDGRADFGEELRAHEVAVGVVNIFEVIEIDEDERKLEGVAMRAVKLGIEHEIQMARVVEAGAIVGDGEFVDALHVARIFNCDRGVVGERFEQGEVALAETFRADAIDEFDDAEAMIAEADGNGDDRARFHFCAFVDLREEARIF